MKRFFDLVVAGTALALLWPLLLLLAALVRAFIGSPVLFRQQRPGRHGRVFTLYKFRTMREAFDGDGHPLPDEARLTRFGCWLRATSLDELPELWNVLCGEMSLVGPRPLLVEYLPRYSATQARRHEVRPGVTGWAQVNGRNAVSWDERLAMDVWYVDNQSLLLDLRIIWMTIWTVIGARGISHGQHATMPKFGGKEDVGDE